MAPALARVLGSRTQSEKERAAPQGRRPTKSKPVQTAYRPQHGPSTAAANSSAKVHTFPRKRVTRRQFASFRLAELRRLAAFRRQHGLCIGSPDTWLFVFAATLGSATEGPILVRRRQRN